MGEPFRSPIGPEHPMSASLSYASTRPVTAEERTAVLDFVREHTDGYRWWAEPIHFTDDPDNPDRLVGNTGLFRLIDDPALDNFMASADMDRIVVTLEAASAEFGIDWQLYLEGHLAGTVTDGHADEQADAAIAGLRSICADLG